MGKNYFDLMEKRAFFPDIDSIRELTVEAQDVSHTFSLSREEPKLVVTLDGTGDILTDDFREFFRLLADARYEEAIENPDGFPIPAGFTSSPNLRFTYRFINGETHTVSFYQGPARRFYICSDDGPAFLLPQIMWTACLERLISPLYPKSITKEEVMLLKPLQKADWFFLLSSLINVKGEEHNDASRTISV